MEVTNYCKFCLFYNENTKFMVYVNKYIQLIHREIQILSIAATGYS